MNYIKHLMCLLLMVSTVCLCSAKQKEGKQRTYMFGFASSFTDSVAYLTDIQAMDSAYIKANGFLADRPLYSLQLYGYLTENLQVKNPTCALFFSLNPKKIAKKYQKVKQMYMENRNVKLALLGKTEFEYMPEEYVADDTFVEGAEEKGGETTEKGAFSWIGRLFGKRKN